MTYGKKPDRVFDGNATLHEGWVVMVQGEKIAFAGPAADCKQPPNAKVIDLKGCTLTPGLIYAHTHLLLHPYDEAKWEDQVSKEPLAERISRATVHARANLLSGFTTMRDLGTEGAQLADVGINPHAVTLNDYAGRPHYLVDDWKAMPELV